MCITPQIGAKHIVKNMYENFSKRAIVSFALFEVKIIASHNRLYVCGIIVNLMERKNRIQKLRMTQILTWKPEQGKTTWSPQNPKQNTMRERNTIRDLRGNDLEILLRQQAAMELTHFHSHSFTLTVIEATTSSTVTFQ